MKKYDVFISSKSEDYPYAEDVYDYLTSKGMTVFFANRELDKIGEADYADAIDTALDDTNHMIVVASSDEHVKSKWVHYEWSTFRNDLNSGYREGNLLTILVKIPPKVLPASLRHQQSFDYESFKEGRIIGYLKTGQTKNEKNKLEQEKIQILKSLGIIPDSDEKEKSIVSERLIGGGKRFLFRNFDINRSIKRFWASFVNDICNYCIIPVIGPEFLVNDENNPGVQNVNTLLLNELIIYYKISGNPHNFEELLRYVKKRKLQDLLSDVCDEDNLFETSSYVKKFLNIRFFRFVICTTFMPNVESVMREMWGNSLKVYSLYNLKELQTLESEFRKLRRGVDYCCPTLVYLYGKANYDGQFAITDDDIYSFCKSWFSIYDDYAIKRFLEHHKFIFWGHDPSNNIDSFLWRDYLIQNRYDKVEIAFFKTIENGLRICPNEIITELLSRIDEEMTKRNQVFDSPDENVDVYISCSKSDIEIAQNLYEVLSSKGVRVWFDKKKIASDVNFSDLICKTIRNANIFVPVISKNITEKINDSEPYCREWRVAIDYAEDLARLYILPLIDNDLTLSRIPKGFQRYHGIFFSREDNLVYAANQIIDVMKK